MSSYEWWRSIAAEWGFAFFAVTFAIGCIYALWPSRKAQFEQAARLPLAEDE